MIGHKWEPAEGTIISWSVEQMELPGRPGMHYVRVYDIDVRTPDGTTGRARVPSAEYSELQAGMIVRLEINAKTGEIRLHPHRDKLQIGFSPVAAAANDDFSGASAAGGTQVNVVGGGITILGGMAGASSEQVSDMLRAVMSADPASRAAAKEQLRQLAQTQGSYLSQGMDAGGALAGFASPASAPGGGTSGRSPSDRLALLQQLFDHGQLSQAEFDAKRQQILDEI
jgi:Short C-terminal domain